jgi:signal transduction histidine kinase
MNFELMAAAIKPDTVDPAPELRSRAAPIIERAPLPLVEVQGTAHLVSYVNSAFCTLVGKTRGELIGKPFAGIVHGGDECVPILDRVYQTGEAATHAREDESEPNPAYWLYAMWPALDADEQPVGVIIQMTKAADFRQNAAAINEALLIAGLRQHELTETAEKLNAQLQREIAERKLTGAALQEAKDRLAGQAGELERLVAERTRELTSANKQLETFVYSIAHDLRAPLRAMQGFSAMLVEEAGAALSETGRNYAGRISKSAQFMDDLLADLLALSSISQQRMDLVPVNLETVVQHALSRLEKDIQEKNARVETIGPWPRVLAQTLTLGQVVFNLMSNALKFAAPDTQPLLRVRAEEQGEFVRVWVEDNGIGIAPEYQEQVFRLFNRLDGEKYSGTGIGLTIVQKGIERMGGRVGLESTPGRGSRFWFELRKA